MQACSLTGHALFPDGTCSVALGTYVHFLCIKHPEDLTPRTWWIKVWASQVRPEYQVQLQPGASGPQGALALCDDLEMTGLAHLYMDGAANSKIADVAAAHVHRRARWCGGVAARSGSAAAKRPRRTSPLRATWKLGHEAAVHS
jgi:hypothetical protein